MARDKPWLTKLPGALGESASAKISRLGISRYQYLQDLVMKDLSVIPSIPKKPPPLPKVLPPARPPWEIFRKVHDFIVNGISKEDDLFKALVAEANRSKCPEWMDDLTKSELEKIRFDLLVNGLCLLPYQSGCLRTMEEEWRASLPKFRPGAPAVEVPEE